MNGNHIFSVLIAEDEPLILNNIAKKAQKVSPAIKIVGKAQNGMEALSILAACHTDILITDIEMPGMSGLELIRRVKKEFPHVHVVILSGYSNFEYARTALKYGVEDYLLKPVEQNVFSDLLLTLCQQIEEERKHTGREILSVALNSASPSDAAPSMFDDGRFCLIHITVGNLPFTFTDSSVLAERFFHNIWGSTDFEECFRNTLNLQHMWVIDERSPQQRFLILHFSDECQSADHLLLTLKNHLTERLTDTPFLATAYQHMICYRDISIKAALLRKAVAAYARPFSQIVRVISDSEEPDHCDPSELYSDMNLLLKLNNETQYLRCIQTTLPEAFRYPAKVLYHCLQFIYDSMSTVFQISPSDCSTAASALYSQLPSMKSSDMLFLTLEASLKELWRNTTSQISSTTLCARLAQHLELNYTNQFSLTELSEKFGYTPSYITRIFKKEYGQSPLQYLTSLRISRAEEIIKKNPDINIRSVALSVGYDDARYFSRIFKNETGMTPTAWIEGLQEKSDI